VDGLPEPDLGLSPLAAVEARRAEIGVPARRGGVEPDDEVEGGLRLGEPLLPGEGDAKVGMGDGELRVEPNGLAEGGLGVGEVAFAEQFEPAIGGCAGRGRRRRRGGDCGRRLGATAELVGEVAAPGPVGEVREQGEDRRVAVVTTLNEIYKIWKSRKWVKSWHSWNPQTVVLRLFLKSRDK
jgi:hypothetical protein